MFDGVQQLIFPHIMPPCHSHDNNRRQANTSDCYWASITLSGETFNLQILLTHLPIWQNGRHFAMIFSAAFLWMKSFALWLKIHCNLFLKVQLPITLKRSQLYCCWGTCKISDWYDYFICNITLLWDIMKSGSDMSYHSVIAKWKHTPWA